jgi:hypothetical protein
MMGGLWWRVWLRVTLAPGPTGKNLEFIDGGDFDRVIAINLRGSFNVTKHAITHMKPRNYGRILLIASIAGKEGNAVSPAIAQSGPASGRGASLACFIPLQGHGGLLDQQGWRHWPRQGRGQGVRRDRHHRERIGTCCHSHRWASPARARLPASFRGFAPGRKEGSLLLGSCNVCLSPLLSALPSNHGCACLLPAMQLWWTACPRSK